MDIAKNTVFKIAVTAALLMLVVATPVTAQFQQDALPHVVFWTNMMGANSDLSQQVSQYAKTHNLRRLPNSYSRVLSNTTTLGGVTVYTASPDDVLCGTPAGAVAKLSIRVFANTDDLLSLPEVQAHRSRAAALEKTAGDQAAHSTRQQEAILKDAQYGYESKVQKDVARIYQRQLADSLSQQEQAQSAEQAINKYAATINSGFAQMSMQERCVWTMGVFIAQNAKNLDKALALANKRAVAQNTSTSLGFGDSISSPLAAPFDMLTVTNTVKAAKSIEHRAFQLGGDTSSTAARESSN